MLDQLFGLRGVLKVIDDTIDIYFSCPEFTWSWLNFIIVQLWLEQYETKKVCPLCSVWRFQVNDYKSLLKVKKKSPKLWWKTKAIGTSLASFSSYLTTKDFNFPLILIPLFILSSFFNLRPPFVSSHFHPSSLPADRSRVMVWLGALTQSASLCDQCWALHTFLTCRNSVEGAHTQTYGLVQSLVHLKKSLLRSLQHTHKYRLPWALCFKPNYTFSAALNTGCREADYEVITVVVVCRRLWDRSFQRRNQYSRHRTARYCVYLCLRTRVCR